MDTATQGTKTKAMPKDRPSAKSAKNSSALPLANGHDDALVTGKVPADKSAAKTTYRETLEPGRSLVLADFSAPSIGAGERFIRLAYRLGVPGSTLTTPFAKPAKTRLLATVTSPYMGDRASGMALRAGHFLIFGVKAPIAQMNFAPGAHPSPPFIRVIHGFSWLRDLASCAPREQCTATAERIVDAWLKDNPKPGKGAAWTVEQAGHRLMAWLVYAPLILSGNEGKRRGPVLDAITQTARWLDRNVSRANDRLGEVVGWCAIIAAGLLLPDGRPRRLYGEAGLMRALGEFAADDGGALSRSPLAQMDAIAALIDLRACYTAVEHKPLPAIEAMLSLLVPPLLTLVHADGGLGNWQGAGAVRADRIAALISASGIRARPLKHVRHWGYQRFGRKHVTLQFDTAPPPLQRHARWGCASTLAFEFCVDGQRLFVNCGGAAFAGGQVPARIEQGLRATAAHSTLVLDETNSTAVHINGRLGAGVNVVDVDRKVTQTPSGRVTRIEASHDGYATRYGLIHRRVLMIREDGHELRGEDQLLPGPKKRARSGMVGYAIRFHCGPGVEVGVTEDKKGAGLALPDGSYWHFRIGSGEGDGKIAVEESMWVDGDGRPHPIEQLVIQGMTPRGGGTFSWLLKKMG